MDIDQILKLAEFPLLAMFVWYSIRTQKIQADIVADMDQHSRDQLDKRGEMVSHLAEVVAANTQAMLAVKESLLQHEERSQKRTETVAEILAHTTEIKRKLAEHHRLMLERHKTA
jgi:ABC-type uncharacterized transport system ATPase component